MMASVLLVCGLIAASPEAAVPAAGDLAAYEAAKAGVGRDPGANVRLALWCEAHGLGAERVKHLALAVLADPTNATARGLLGLVAYHDQWKRPESIAAKVKADGELTARLAEYNARRAKTADTADAQWSLAVWCERNGLDAEARAHFTAVTRHDPAREAAWKRLGFKKANGRWVTEAQVAAEKAEAEAQKKADRHWKPLLTKWRGWLGDKNKRAAAEAALGGVNDPRAVPSVWAVFVARGPAHRDLVVRVLGRLDAPGSSRALAFLAVFDASPEVRRAATETLRRRDPREYAGVLIGLLRDPVKYQVRPVGGPGSPGAIFIAGRRSNVQRIYSPPGVPYVPVSPNDRIGPDSDGLPMIVRSQGFIDNFSVGNSMLIRNFPGYNPADPAMAQAVDAFRATTPLNYQTIAHSIPGPIQQSWLRSNPGFELSHIHVNVAAPAATPERTDLLIPIGQMMAEYRRAAVSAQNQLERDTAALDAYNDGVQTLNASAARVLADVSGKSLNEDRTAWTQWWVNIQGYAYNPPQEAPVPTYVENVPLDYIPSATPVGLCTVPTGPTVVGQYRVGISSDLPVSCFGAGTAVRTLDGSHPIESIKVGDRVLTQDVKSGALGYQPVTVVHHNPPSPTFLVKVGRDTIVSSPFHRFWVAGKGWVMARDLKGGEVVRTLDGPSRVDSVETGPVQPVFNLDVAGDHDFFAGSAAALVHDNTLPDTRLTPFDAAPALAGAGGETPAR